MLVCIITKHLTSPHPAEAIVILKSYHLCIETCYWIKTNLSVETRNWSTSVRGKGEASTGISARLYYCLHVALIKAGSDGGG